LITQVDLKILPFELKFQVNGAGGIKRPADSNGENSQAPPAKRSLFDCNGSLIANGSQIDQENSNSLQLKVEGGVSQTMIVNNGQPMVQVQIPQQAVLQGQTQPVTVQGQTIQLQGQTVQLQGQTLQLQGQQLQVQSSPGMITPQIVIQPQQLIAGNQKIVTGSDGKQYLIKTTPVSTNGAVLGTLTSSTPQATNHQQTQLINGSSSTGQVIKLFSKYSQSKFQLLIT